MQIDPSLHSVADRNDDAFVAQIFLPLEGFRIELPEKFIPSIAFLSRHRNEIFIDAAGQ